MRHTRRVQRLAFLFSNTLHFIQRGNQLYEHYLQVPVTLLNATKITYLALTQYNYIHTITLIVSMACKR